MTKKILALGVAASLALASGLAVAELREGYVYLDSPTADHPLDEIISGYEFRDDATRALQADDFENPGFLLLEQGQDLWSTVDGSEGKSCETCHGDVTESMAGVGSTYPKIMMQGGERKLTNIENQINTCRTERMGAEAWKYDKAPLQAMTILVKNVDRGEPVNVTIDGEYEPWFKQGEELYYTRVGQLDMSCAHCHEAHYGQFIRADHLSQGQTNGFPTYRFKWSGQGSLHRRFSGCIKNIRGEPYSKGGDEFLALELYTAWRGQGLPIETPSVRN